MHVSFCLVIAGSWQVQRAERGLAGWSSNSSTMRVRSHTAPQVSAQVTGDSPAGAPASTEEMAA